MVKRLSQNTLILLISNVGSAVLSFLIAILIGRHYGEGGLGLYASVLAWIFPLSFLVEFGFGTLITRDIAQKPELASRYLELTWQFRHIVGGGLTVILSVVVIMWTDQASYYIISSPLIIILPAYSAYTAIFRAHQRMLPIAFLNLGMLMTQVTLIIIAIQNTAPIILLFFINTLTSSAQLFVAIWIYRKHFYRKQKSTSTISLIDLLRRSKSFAIAGILSAIQTRFSIIWLEAFGSVIIVGLFIASLRFVEGARMIPNALFGAVYPALSALTDNREALNKLFIRLMILLGIYGITIASILFVFGEQILQLTFGDNFIEAQSALAIMGLALIPFVLRSGWSLFWYALGLEQTVNRVLFINLILLITIPNLIWFTSLHGNALLIISYAILYTELITLTLMAIHEAILWRSNNI